MLCREAPAAFWYSVDLLILIRSRFYAVTFSNLGKFFGRIFIFVQPEAVFSWFGSLGSPVNLESRRVLIFLPNLRDLQDFRDLSSQS